MSERRGTKALELWCRRITEGYPGVNVQNMTTSWKDGLAFCAMIHHFRPDLIDFDSLDKNNVQGNNELAFRIAEQHLGIPALLDAEDMASCSTPDRLSILTYLSQFYQMLGGSSPSRLAMNRTTESPEEKITPLPGSPKEKAALGLGVRRDLCTVCGLPVFLAEKLVLGSAAYHRTCFRCARCSNQLTLGNYYETEEGQYCCETCPDEELTSATIQNYANVAMSDKSETNEIFEDLCCNEESTNPPTTDDHSATRMDFGDASVPDIIVQTSRLRLNFISNHLLSNQDTADGIDFKCSANLPDQQESESRNSTSGQLEFQSRRNEDSLNREGSGNNFVIERSKSQPTRNEKSFDGEHSNESIDRNFAKTDSAHEELMNNEEELTTASYNDIIRNKSVDSATKINAAEELLNDETVEPVDTANCLSLVQARLRLFENTKNLTEKGRSQNIDVLRPQAQSKKHNLIEKDSKEPTINLDVIGIEESTSKFKVSEDITENHVNDALDNTSFNKLASLRISETTGSSDDALADSTKNSHTKKIENDTMIHSQKSYSQEKPKNKGNSENQAIVSVASETNSMNSTSAATKIDYPENLNPFNSDEEEDSNAHSIITNPSQTSTNPFKDEETMEEEFEKMEQYVIPTPAARNNVDNHTAKSQSHEEVSTKRRLIAPQINLNPFWSDDDDQESDLDCKTKIQEAKPVPKPRTRNIQELETNAPKSNQNYTNLNTSNSSVTSLESATSFGATCRKKKPAPLPPNRKEQCSPDQHAPLTSPSNTISKARKIKPAPPPPMQTSSPYNISINTSLNCEASPISKSGDENKSNKVWEDEKISKDVANRNRQSFTHVPCKEGLYDRSFVDKSTEGKWKRKKGPAPPCPMPLKRKIKVMSLKDVKLELDEIELQQQGLEKQGVRLEQLIRSKCESESKPDDVSLGTAVEELVLELFALVNEKNELFRRQAELMLLRRQQRLEEEHAEVEYQIRCLMSQQESMKTDFDKQREEALIKRLVEIVERRNEIVDCLEMDRRREIEEDRSIHKHMDLFAVKNKNQTSDKDSTQRKSKQKENKLKDKTKEKKLKKILKKDIDKDIDEIELKLKRHNKRKWF